MAPTAHVEREVKLAVWPGFRLPDLSGIRPDAVVTSPVDQHLEATYHDTADLRLGRSGITLRYRTGDVDGWTLKLPKSAGAGALVRTELTVAGDPKTMPTELSDIVAARARTAPLVPVARLHTLRRLTRLEDAEGELLAEVVDDEVSVLDGRRVALRFREVEVELGDAGDQALLDDVVRVLRRAGAGEPDPTPKVIRALGPAAAAPADLELPPLTSRPAAVDVLRAGLARSVGRLVGHDPGVREGLDPEAVHQARVATRRLRSDLRVYGPLLDAEWAGGLREELSWLADLLGGVRDGDVLLARLERQLATLVPDDRALGAELLTRLRSERDTRRAALLEGVRSTRYLALLERLVDAANAPMVLDGADRDARAVLPPLARAPWESFFRAARRVNPKTAEETLHEVRIRAKRARYAAEVAALAIGKPPQRLADALADVQEVLGDRNDASVAEAWLRDAAVGAPADVAFVAGELAMRQRWEADDVLTRWPAVWDRVRKGRLTEWLKP